MRLAQRKKERRRKDAREPYSRHCDAHRRRPGDQEGLGDSSRRDGGARVWTGRISFGHGRVALDEQGAAAAQADYGIQSSATTFMRFLLIWIFLAVMLASVLALWREAQRLREELEIATKDLEDLRDELGKLKRGRDVTAL